MQVPLAAIVSMPKLRKRPVRGRRTRAEAPELLHDLRLPAAIDAPPAVPEEAQNPQPSVIRIVSPLGARTAECVPFPPVFIATSAAGERWTFGDGT
jgi:hypothetical protein